MKRTMSCFGTLVALMLTITDTSPAAVLYRSQTRASAPAASSAGGEACSALKKEDVAMVLGGTVNGPTGKGPLSDGTGSTITSCQYSGSGLMSVTLNVTRLPAAQVATFKSFCTDHEGLAGLGDLSCWYDKKHEEIHVFKGTALISIELRGKSNPTDSIKALAKKVADQIK